MRLTLTNRRQAVAVTGIGKAQTRPEHHITEFTHNKDPQVLQPLEASHMGALLEEKLPALLDRHTALVIRVLARKEHVQCDESLNEELLMAIAAEQSLCQQLVDFPANSIEEAEAKIVHFIGYLWQTKGFFDEEALERFLFSLKHASKQA
jgi:hypothetical protein